MRIVVIGLGSMGKRRARLVHELDPEAIIVGVDTNKQRRIEFVDAGYGVLAFSSLSEANDAYTLDAAFVCTSPISHSAVISECLHYGLHVFTEINLVSDGYEENMSLAEERNLVLFLSSTFLYRRETRKIIQEAQAHRGGLYSYHVGQYLPDWHPWENYKDFFMANPRTNGCRELFAIELPWLEAAFGPVVSVQVESDKQSSLELPYNDTYAVMLRHEGGAIGMLAIDVVCRNPVRHFEYSHEDSYLSWNGTPDSLLALDFADGALKPVELYLEGEGVNLEGYARFVVEDAYREEVTCFLNAVDGAFTPSYGFADDASVLRLIDEIEGLA